MLPEGFKILSSSSVAVDPALRPEPQSFSKGQCHGKILTIDVDAGSGVVSLDGTADRMFFFFSKLKNVGDTEVVVTEGTAVRVVTDKRDAFKTSPRAFRVYVGEPKNDNKVQSTVQQKEKISNAAMEVVTAEEQSAWCDGRITSPTSVGDKIYLTEIVGDCSEPRSFCLFREYLPNLILPLKKGDVLQFKVNPKNLSKIPAIKNFKILRYESYRCRVEIEDYFENIHKAIEKNEDLMTVLKNKAQWEFLGSSRYIQPSGLGADYCFAFWHLLARLLESSNTLIMNPLREMLITTLSGSLFQGNDVFKFGNLRTLMANCDLQTDAKSFKIALNFCSAAIRMHASCAKVLLPVIESISQAQDFNSDIHMFTILKSLINATDCSELPVMSNWKDVPMRITQKELENGLLEHDSFLVPVQVTEPYRSSEEYMITYYPLLRAELYFSIQQGIKNYLAGDLDHRDMNVFTDIRLSQVNINYSNLIFALSFQPHTPVKNWAFSTQLMTGNLLALSINGTFDDVIWFTIAKRDEDLLQKESTILVESCQEGNMSVTSLITKLSQECNPKSVMVESPVFYKSINPVLESLRAFDMDNFQLKDQILSVTPSCFSQGSVESIDKPLKRYRRYGENYEQRIASCEATRGNLRIMEGLEESQRVAFQHALSHKVAIIQGPPGCGKTFIGARLVEFLLQYDVPCGPIMLLTYKNHALDEFLKHVLQFCDSIVRIGNRSSEPELTAFLLKTICDKDREEEKFVYEDYEYYDRRGYHRTGTKKYISGWWSNMQNLYNQVNVSINKLTNLLKKLDDSTEVNIQSLMFSLTQEQLSNLVLKTPWTKKDTDDFFQQFGLIFDKNYLKSILHYTVYQCDTLLNFICLYEQGQLPQEDIWFAMMYFFLQRALRLWMPDKKELQIFQKLEQEFCKERKEKNSHKRNLRQNDEWDELDFDEEFLEELKQERDIEFTSQYQKTHSKEKTETEVRFSNRAHTRAQRSKTGTFYHRMDFPSNMKSDISLLGVSDLWLLSHFERLRFIFTIISESEVRNADSVEGAIRELSELQQERQWEEILFQANCIKERALVGMTITGASIHHELVKLIQPEVVIVEEAAEILEPSLLAALSPGTKHLILIGDHKQLRPQVDTFKLVQQYHLDVSMMERLIKSGYPFETLAKQNRMKPEISKYLRAIYPGLKDNLEHVAKNSHPPFLEKPIFFWSHNHLESGDRSICNEGEAIMVIALTRFLFANGCHPKNITILTPYLGQTKLLRRLVKNSIQPFEDVLPSVHTIDMYQGDENKYVIVSLVRCNDRRSIGFVKDANRKCVAQSRAKCLLYFVGSAETIRSAKSSWSGFMTALEKDGCLGSSFNIQCKNHKDESRHSISDEKDLMKFVENPQKLCTLKCGKLLPCGHMCKKDCFPRHDHAKCWQQVQDVFPECGHGVSRPCWKSIADLQCEERVPINFQECGHKTLRKCSTNPSSLTCQIPCQKMMACGKHGCSKKCGKKHEHTECKTEIVFTFTDCGHKTTKECHIDPNNFQCQKNLEKKFQSCDHTFMRECFKRNSSDPVCENPCGKDMLCGLHKCQEICWKSHDHVCKEEVEFMYPSCKHPSMEARKPCMGDIQSKCTYPVQEIGSCGHLMVKKCHQPIKEAYCQSPCERKRPSCGHECRNVCGDDCDQGTCIPCAKIKAEQFHAFKEAAQRRVEELEEKLRKGDYEKFSRIELSRTGATSGEFLTVEDQVLKYIKPNHNWYPTVSKIEKIANLELEKRFEDAKTKCFDNVVVKKFHGTSRISALKIIQNGFKLPESGEHMFGKGIYFATDSSKSARTIYTKGSNQLLLCDVIIGRTKVMDKADPKLDRKALQEEYFDSAFAPRGSAVLNDEYVIFNPAQALPRYIIHYDTNEVNALPLQDIQPTHGKSFTKIELTPSRKFDINDALAGYYNLAESFFHRMMKEAESRGRSADRCKIEKIELVKNIELERRFNQKKKEFKGTKVPHDEILAFHGTRPVNIDSILATNLDCDRTHVHGQAHGKGNYFSELPNVSLGYGEGLLLFRVLPGNEYKGSEKRLPPGYQSKNVNPTDKGFGDMLVIENSDQFLPYFVYHLKKL